MSESTGCPACGDPLAESGVCPNCATQVFTGDRSQRDLQISGYDILGRIGEGGMGAIYLAEEKSLGRRVAIKVIAGKLASDPQARARFMREARALATVEHPNVVRVYSFGEIQSHPYLAMEYVDGETLAERIRRNGMLSVEESTRILRQILEALDAAWEKGIVHRDIKPSNILIDRRSLIHVVDFGLAKSAQSAAEDGSITQEGSVLGTPYYLAPEQAQGQPADFRADVYSCGILLYEMLTGQRPFEGTTPLAIVAKHIHEPLPSIRSKRQDVPNRVVRLLEKMTNKRPSERAASYRELLSIIDGILGITPTKPIAPTETFPRVPIAAPRQYAVPLALVAVLILAVAAISFRDRFGRAAPVRADAAGFVVAVAPFYGPDSESEREGRLMAALVERSIQARLGEENVHVIGIDETKTAVRQNDAARELGQRLDASVVVWGEAFALRNETEIQPHFTIIKRARSAEVETKESERERPDLASPDPTASLERNAPAAMRLEAQAPNQIELRKTSAEGVGEVVSLLAAVHALYTENNPKKALSFLDQAPRSVDALRCRADAYLQVGETDKAAAAYAEVLTLAPADTNSHARLGDLDLRAGNVASAAEHYRAASESKQPYTTQNGIEFNGSLYERETYRSEMLGTGGEDPTGYLLVRNPQSGKVTSRVRVPGIIQSFTPTEGGISISTIDRESSTTQRIIRFVNGEFDRPLTYVGGNLLLRTRSMKGSWILASNYIDELTGRRLERQPAMAQFRLKKDPDPQFPTTLPALETALRSAIDRDATQPWHLFFLAQTLMSGGRVDEANATWNQLFSRRFPVPYTDWTWMSHFFERLNQRELADRAWERALRERRRIPQPVQVSTLIEHLINVPVTRLHEAERTDGERAYLWMQRARSLSGVPEGEHFATAAWAAHFQRQNDARAAGERRRLQLVRADPMNFTAAAARLDYAFDFWIATSIGLFLTLVLMTGIALERSSEQQGTKASWREWLHPAIGTIPRPWGLILGALAAAAAVYAAIRLRIELESGSLGGPAPIAGLIALIALLILARRLFRLTGISASLRRIERTVLLAAFAVSLAATLTLVREMNRQSGLGGLPIGLADSIGHAGIVEDFESRLSKHPTDALRYSAAVANDFAGNVDRAKTLYRDVPNDLRAKAALTALEQGRSVPVMPSSDELVDAYAAGSSKWLMANAQGTNLPAGLNKIFNLFSWGTLLLTAIVLVTSLFVPFSNDVPLRRPSSRWRRAIRKTALMILPGYYDLRHATPWRGALLLMLSGFCAWFIVTSQALRVPGAVGIISAIATPNYNTAFPMPMDVRTIDLYLAPPGAALFFGIAFVCVLALITLHAMRLRTIWNHDRSLPEHAAPPVSITQTLEEPS